MNVFVCLFVLFCCNPPPSLLPLSQRWTKRRSWWATRTLWRSTGRCGGEAGPRRWSGNSRWAAARPSKWSWSGRCSRAAARLKRYRVGLRAVGAAAVSSPRRPSSRRGPRGWRTPGRARRGPAAQSCQQPPVGCARWPARAARQTRTFARHNARWQACRPTSRAIMLLSTTTTPVRHTKKKQEKKEKKEKKEGKMEEAEKPKVWG